MTARKLTSEQIDNLFELCDYYHISYYDIQIELVDHMASAIETLWATNPELPFEEAAFMVGEQLGGKSGFISFRETKAKELRRKYSRMQWKYIEEFFQLPKIILTLVMTFILYFIFQHSNDYMMIISIIQFMYIFFILASGSIFIPKKLRLKIISDKEFLLYNFFKNFRNSVAVIGIASFNILLFSLRQIHKMFDSTSIFYFNTQLLIAFMITSLGIMIYAFGVYSPLRIKEDFVREFPQFVKS